MTMFPVNHRQINKNSYGGYDQYGGGCGCGYSYYDECGFISLSGGGSSDLMADQDESRAIDELLATANNTASTASKDINNQKEVNNKGLEEDTGRWLQLSLGSSTGPYRPSVELDLLPGGSGSSSSGGGGGGADGGETLSLTLTAPPRQQVQQNLSFHQVPITAAAATAGGATYFLQPHQRGWAAVAIDSAPPIPMALTSHQQHYDRNYVPFRPHPLSMTASSGGRPLDDLHAGGPPLRMNFRVVDPPPRPHSGVWFILQASQNQIKEPYLPQVPKSYLRIKDGRTTTVGLLIKYLVDKLKLDSQFEIEITCKGQQLLPFLTLQHVRDNIWNRPRNDVVFPHSSTTIVDHLMVLNYGRIA